MSASKFFRCAIYTRTSSEEGLDQEFNSLDAQREACEAYVKSQAGEGWKVLKSRYDDGGFSGGSMERPALEQLLSDTEKNLIDVVVVYKVDRLTRALTDFTRIVDIFESKNVSFVSVTQAFNTTTSMGRLTLNVLLSFAQFEREVIGERIRDKVAASKKKGIWMGGIPPLGYEVRERRLVVNPDEAKLVQDIYLCYLKLGSVPYLVNDLKKRKIRGKSWTTQKGILRRGGYFARGGLYRLLNNPIYLGHIRHKEKIYSGLHEPIVSQELWDKVQAMMDLNRRRRSKTVSSEPAHLLSRLLFDDQGHPMYHSHTTKAGGRRYRYYVSRPILERNSSEAGSVPRVPAHAIEEIVREHVRGLLPASLRNVWKKMPPHEQAMHLRETLKRVTIHAQEVEFILSKGAFDPQIINSKSVSFPGELFPGEEESLVLRIPIRLKTWRGEKLIQTPQSKGSEHERRPDKTLIKAVARAFAWRETLEKGEIESVSDLARGAVVSYHYAKRLLKLSFLAPDIVEKILQGRQPREVNLSHILQLNLPLCWKAQRVLLGFSTQLSA